MEYTLLVIEDDGDTSEMLRVYFEAQGYHVVTALTGQDGLDKCRTSNPDLILLDVRLPDMEGFEVGKHLQNDVQTSRLPVIFVTERQGRDDRIAGLKLGAVDYITKPFDVQELRLRVRNALRRAGNQNNPITGLPGDKITGDRLYLLLGRDDLAVLGIYLYGLEKFNEIYGFVARDDVLRAVALTLTGTVDEVGSVDDFVGHPQENQFIIVTTPQQINTLEQQISRRLNQAMIYFYPIHDREAGFVQTGPNAGDTERVPFMGIKTASIHISEKRYTSVQSITDALWQNLS